MPTLCENRPRRVIEQRFPWAHRRRCRPAHWCRGHRPAGSIGRPKHHRADSPGIPAAGLPAIRWSAGRTAFGASAAVMGLAARRCPVQEPGGMPPGAQGLQGPGPAMPRKNRGRPARRNRNRLTFRGRGTGTRSGPARVPAVPGCWSDRAPSASRFPAGPPPERDGARSRRRKPSCGGCL